MPRAPFQVLILPYRAAGDAFEFAVLARSDDGRWQGLAGGGEGSETPLEAARREALEEAGIPPDARFVELQAPAPSPRTSSATAPAGANIFTSSPNTASG